MPKLKILIVGLMIVVILSTVLPLTVFGQLQALYRCTVYEDGDLAGPGVTVAAYVGTETSPRGQATTSVLGVAIVQFGISTSDLGSALSFKVNGVAAAETPDVNVTTAPPQVRLDVGDIPGPTPTPAPTDLWKDYDDNNDNALSLTEVLDAVADTSLTDEELISVLEFYFSQAPD